MAAQSVSIKEGHVVLRTSEVIVVDYDPEWPVLFEREREVIWEAVGKVELHHIGSTSVYGLCAKPIIDMMMAVPTLSRVDDLTVGLVRVEYELGSGSDVRVFLSKRTRKAYHLHIVEENSSELRRHLVFRDRLRCDPAAAEAYGELKRLLANRYRNDRQAYMQGKDAFIQRVSGSTGECRE